MKTVEIGQKARHIRTGGHYQITGRCLMKVNDVWVEGVIYESLLDKEPKPTFVRELDAFKKNFEEWE